MKLLSSEQILDLVVREKEQYRATLKKLKAEGKSYRSREVTRTVACMNALYYIEERILSPQKELELREAVKTVAQRLKG